MPGAIPGVKGLYPSILNEQQCRILPCLAAVADNVLYLAGGTALALQLGHRFSVDFDWFAATIGNQEELFKKLRQVCSDFQILSTCHETVHIQMQGVQVSFLGYDYPLLQPLVFWQEGNCHLADIQDIACMKLAAITGRGARKDFIDLHRIISDHYDLQACFVLFKQKYRQQDIGHVIRSLVYFEDAELEPDIIVHDNTSWHKVKSDFTKWVKGLPKGCLTAGEQIMSTRG